MYLLIFLGALLYDILWTKWMFHTIEVNPWRASIYSGLIVIIGCLFTVIVVEDHYSIAPLVLGHMTGSYFGVYLIKKPEKT